MQCKICGSEIMKTIASPRRYQDFDIRRLKCEDCGQEYISESRIKHLLHYNSKKDLKKAEEEGLISRLQDEYMINKKKKMEKLRYKDE